MEITLEKIELVKDRTGVSYKEAKEALEQNEGNVVDAIISIEESIDNKAKTKFSAEKVEIIEKIKEIIKKGNASKILFKKDEEIILNIPITAGIIGTAIAPWAAMAGMATALITKCKIEVVKENGEVVDINEFTNDKFGDIKNKADGVFDEMKNKAEDVFSNVKNKVDQKINKKNETETEATIESESANVSESESKCGETSTQDINPEVND